MTGSERRDQIINQIKKSSIPVSGAQLAKEFDVSRQVIVQDIALIRAAGHEIISTNRGYLLNTPHSVNRIFKVNHTDEELEDELCTVVDLGGSATFYRGRFEFGLKSSDRFLVWHRSVGYRLAGGHLSCLLYNFFSSGLGAEGQLRVISFRA